MATIPGVSDGELIRTSWGDAVADELNNNTVKLIGTSSIAGTLVASNMYLANPTPGDATAVARRDFVTNNFVSKFGDVMTGGLSFDGNPYVGDQGTTIQGGIIAVNKHSSTGSNLYLMHTGSAFANGSHYATFCASTGAVNLGAIIQSGTSDVSYYSASDYRLKDDLGPIVDPVGQLMALRPKHLRWKSDGREFDGFIAHELDEVIPYAVNGEKDATTPQGDIDAQMTDNTYVVPLLTAALQEAHTQIAALTARLDALEAAA